MIGRWWAVEITFSGGVWDGESIVYNSTARDIYPGEAVGMHSEGTGFYVVREDEPVADWIPFEFGNGLLGSKLQELGLL